MKEDKKGMDWDATHLKRILCDYPQLCEHSNILKAVPRSKEGYMVCLRYDLQDVPYCMPDRQDNFENTLHTALARIMGHYVGS